MANEDDDNEIPVEFTDSIAQEAEDILEEMDERVDSTRDADFGFDRELAGGDWSQLNSDELSEQGDEAYPGMGVGDAIDDLFGGEMSREQKVIHMVQNEPEYILKTFGGSVALSLLIKYGGRKVGISDYSLGVLSVRVADSFRNWMFDRYDP